MLEKLPFKASFEHAFPQHLCPPGGPGPAHTAQPQPSSCRDSLAARFVLDLDCSSLDCSSGTITLCISLHFRVPLLLPSFEPHFCKVLCGLTVGDKEVTGQLMVQCVNRGASTASAPGLHPRVQATKLTVPCSATSLCCLTPEFGVTLQLWSLSLAPTSSTQSSSVIPNKPLSATSEVMPM